MILIPLKVNISPSYYWCCWKCNTVSMLWRFMETLWVNRHPLSILIKHRLLIPGMVHLRCRVLLKQLTYYGLFRISWRYNSYKSALLVASSNRLTLILFLPSRHPPRFLIKKQIKKKSRERIGFAMQLQITSSSLQINWIDRHSPTTAPKMLCSYSYAEFYSQA